MASEGADGYLNAPDGTGICRSFRFPAGVVGEAFVVLSPRLGPTADVVDGEGPTAESAVDSALCVAGEVCVGELTGDKTTPESAFDTFRSVDTRGFGVVLKASPSLV